MPVGPATCSDLLPINGVKLASVAAGIRYENRDDLMLMRWPETASCAAVFTLNRFCAAPVVVARNNIRQWPVAALVNSGNANAGTGEAGMKAALESCSLAAKALGCSAEQVLPFSTGVIGELLPTAPFEGALPGAVNGLSESGWNRAADAILTTDTRPKGYSRQFKVGGKLVTLTGICKGSGMIRPDMATMLAYVATDAAIAQADLQQALKAATDQSFNQISVDGDTSTNDALLLVATGDSDFLTGTDLADFTHELTALCVDLAQAIVRDGEGATKFISIEVSGAVSDADAKSVAETVAHSPLVKTALFASDANWGRILAAVGRAPVSEMALEKIAIQLGDVSLIEGGEPAKGYTENAGAAVMAGEEITIAIQLGLGDGEATIWTCDLSHDYVSINADYRS